METGITRREFVGAATFLAGGVALGISEGVRKMEPLERLYLVNTCARYRFEMAFKEKAPIILKESSYPVHEHTTMCLSKEAFALTGILVDGDPDARIRVSIDGEYILKDVSPARASAARFPDGFTVGRYPGDIFLAETPERTEVGLFLPNATRIQVHAQDRPAKMGVTLRMALYSLKDPRPQEV